MYNPSTTIEKTAQDIVRRLTNHGCIAYFAGGWVRDRLLGTTHNADIDIATNATPQTVAKIFPQAKGVGEHFGVMLVMENEIPFEVATFRTDIGSTDGRHPDKVVFTDAKHDAERRDFTVNGLFFDPLTDTIYDFINGQKDIADKCIRAIGDPAHRFSEDYLRLLRAIRFAARLDFSIDEATWQALKEHHLGLKTISGERIFAEMTKILTHPSAERGLRLMMDCGILAVILPEVDAMRGVEQPIEFHPEGDVFEHTLKTLSLIKERTPVTVWSALLHDIGKPSTMVISDRIRFNNHQRIGAELAQTVLRRLKCSRAFMDDVYTCIDNHMNFMNVTKMRLSTLKKFIGRPTIKDELELHRVDCLASHGGLENFDFVSEKLTSFAATEVKPLPLLCGADLIAMGFSQGPIIGKILSEVYDLQLEDKLASLPEARKWVDNHRKNFET
jgi:poly(A) polymerase